MRVWRVIVPAEFEWDPRVDGLEPPPAGLLAFWADGPEIDLASVWAEVKLGLHAEERARPVGRIRLLRGATAGQATRLGASAAAIVVGVIVGTALLVSSSGTARAGFAAEVADLSAQTAAALDDGALSASEAARLEALAGGLVARLEAGEDLAALPASELDAVIRTLLGVEADLTATTKELPETGAEALASVATVGSAVGDARTSQSGGGSLLPVLLPPLPPGTVPLASGMVVTEVAPLAFFPLTVLADDGGSVVIRLIEDGLEVGSVRPAEGWRVDVDQGHGETVAVTFTTVDASVAMSASLQGGGVAVQLVIQDGRIPVAVAPGAAGDVDAEAE